MKKILLILSLALIGCNHKEHTSNIDWSKVPVTIPDTITDHRRGFLITYSCYIKDYNQHHCHGFYNWRTGGDFPACNDIRDSILSKCNKGRKTIYRVCIIENIFEFTTYTDYAQFCQ